MSDKKMEIRVDNQIAHGVYSNNFVVSSSPTEVTIDFLYQNYQQALLQSRVILTPQKIRELVVVLQQQIQDFEDEESNEPSIN